MSITVISILAILAFGSSESFLGGIIVLVILMAAVMSLASGFGVVPIQ